MALTTAYQPAHDTAADTSTTSPVQRAATTATASAGGFVALLAVLHLLKPELDPSWRMVSEYEIGRHGWVMRLAFGCLAVACVSLHAALRGKVHGIAGRVGRAGLLAGAAGTALAGAFASDPITATKDQLTMQGNLHGLGFTMGVPGMLLAVGLVTRAVRRSQPTSAGAVRWFAPRLGQPCRLPRHHGRHLRRHVRARRPGRLAQPAARGQLRRLDHLHRPCGPPRRALLRSHRHDYPQDQRERCRGIDAYLTSLPERLGDVAAARAAIDTALPEAHATIWHGQPVWSRGADTGRNPICLLKAYTSHVTLGLWQGQAVDDPTGRLEPGSRDMASVKMRSVEDVDPDAIASWLQQAWRLYE